MGAIGEMYCHLVAPQSHVPGGVLHLPPGFKLTTAYPSLARSAVTNQTNTQGGQQ
jgi:hypothetical protein